MSLPIHKNIIIHSRSIMVPRRGRLSGPGLIWGSGPLIRRSNDASTDRGEAAISSRGAGSYAQGGGGACQRISLDPDPSGVRRATSLYADRDEDRQGIRRAPRGVGGGVASLTIPKITPICRFSGASRCANFTFIGFVRSSLGKLQNSLEIHWAR